MHLQPGKCTFRLSAVRCYGHVLTESELPVEQDKVKAVLEMNKPTNKEKLRRFLGMVAHVAKFLPGQAQVAAPCENLCVKRQQ